MCHLVQYLPVPDDLRPDCHVSHAAEEVPLELVDEVDGGVAEPRVDDARQPGLLDRAQGEEPAWKLYVGSSVNYPP